MSGLVITYTKLNYIVIDGITLYGGDTITIGGTIVTIVIDGSCTTYTS